MLIVKRSDFRYDWGYSLYRVEEMLPEILIIFFLLLLNGFFSLSEMALVSSSKPLLKQMEREGNRGAALAVALSEDSGKFLSTVQVGITLVGTLAGAYGGANIAEKLRDSFNTVPVIDPHGETVAMVIVVAIITYLSVVIGELLPKQLALSNPERLAVFVARPMTFLSRVCTPVVVILERSADMLMFILRVKKKSDDSVTEAEVKAVLSGGAESGVIDKSEHDMLQRIIRLGDRDINSVMTHRMEIASLDINDGLDDIREKINNVRHTRYLVTNGNIDTIVGVVEVKEILEALLHNKDFNLRNHLKKVTLFPETSHCLEVIDVFKKSKIHIAVVVDEYGSTQGIVTASDLLEAIVGALPSNYDEKEHALIVRRDDDSWLVDGITPLAEIHLQIGLDDIKDTGEYDTIAGFILHDFGKVPAEGDMFEKYDFSFEIVDMDSHRIDKILIRKKTIETP